ncbi:hypothetical protein ACFTY8_42150 [Streptomyces mirabilis]|uniref:hypothetical protein n=1 Tax=Streptomyces mirabilis TaxID=68239 RepID=UPI00363EBDC2
MSRTQGRQVPGQSDLRFTGGLVTKAIGGVDEHRHHGDHRGRALFDGLVVGDL